jgi:ABC-type branched-subunit amino acid transport system permease subunit
MVFGVAVVLLMMVRPQGLVTRTMLERLTTRSAEKGTAR